MSNALTITNILNFKLLNFMNNALQQQEQFIGQHSKTRKCKTNENRVHIIFKLCAGELQRDNYVFVSEWLPKKQRHMKMKGSVAFEKYLLTPSSLNKS